MDNPEWKRSESSDKVTVEDFECLMKDLHLEQATILNIVRSGIDCPEALAFINDTDIENMDLCPSQRHILKRVIDLLNNIDESDSDPNTSQGSSSSDLVPGNVNKDYLDETDVLEALESFRQKTAGSVKTGVANVKRYLGSESKAVQVSTVAGMRRMKLLSRRQVYQDKEIKIRHCILGTPDVENETKTIILVGERKSGKSTLIDGICNFIFDFEWDETHRCKLIDECEDEQMSVENAKAATKWMTIYTIHCGPSNRLPFTLNIVDMPGFAHIRGITQSKIFVNEIEALIKTNGTHGIGSIDALCIVTKSVDAQLTINQRFMYDSILSVFGKRLRDNILVMATFVNEGNAPILNALQAAAVPYSKALIFNNAALYVNNHTAVGGFCTSMESQDNTPANDILAKYSKFFWERGNEMYKYLFDFLNGVKSHPLKLTHELLEKWQSLSYLLMSLQTDICNVLKRKKSLEKEKQDLENNKKVIQDNQDYEQHTTEYYTEKVEVNRDGKIITYCIICDHICHDSCGYATDTDKKNCTVIDKTGYCKECPGKCHWSHHRCKPYRNENRSRTLEHIDHEKFDLYNKAIRIKEEKENLIKDMEMKIGKSERKIEGDAEKCNSSLENLNEIALKRNPLTQVDFVELLIQGEVTNKKKGWEMMLDQLYRTKAHALLLQKICNGQRVFSASE